jgi:putative flavoprotein involved in K+ transport
MDVVVVGAGQAGLAVSRALGVRGVDHVVLEADRVASAWQRRWDSFTPVTPNWTLALPGAPYAGDDPEGHVPRDQIVDHLQAYADTHAGPVETGVPVERLSAAPAGRFRLETSTGPVECDQVVVCTGAFPAVHRPAIAGAFPDHVTVLDATGYRAPDQLPEAPVLVVGSGQTGVQLAAELQASGRPVTLACGRAPWLPRRLDGEDVITALERTSYFDMTLADLPDPRWRLAANPQLSGAGGGRDLHYRVLQEQGVTLAGRLRGVRAGRAELADDLADSVAFGDARYAALRALLGAEAAWPDPAPFTATAPDGLDLARVGAVVLTSGFRPDHARWVELPVFDDLGYPVVDADLATAVPGLYFCGVHWLRTRRSSVVWGVGDDAELVAETLVRRSR